MAGHEAKVDGQCPECGRWLACNWSDCLFKHGMNGKPCPGSGMKATVTRPHRTRRERDHERYLERYVLRAPDLPYEMRLSETENGSIRHRRISSLEGQCPVCLNWHVITLENVITPHGPKFACPGAGVTAERTRPRGSWKKPRNKQLKEARRRDREKRKMTDDNDNAS